MDWFEQFISDDCKVFFSDHKICKKKWNGNDLQQEDGKVSIGIQPSPIGMVFWWEGEPMKE